MKFNSILILFVAIFSQLALTSAANYPENGNTIQENIRENIEKLERSKTIKLNGEKIIGNTVITELYKDMDFKPLWDNMANRNDLIDILEDSYFEGLNPLDYHIAYIKSNTKDISSKGGLVQIQNQSNRLRKFRMKYVKPTKWILANTNLKQMLIA